MTSFWSGERIRLRGIEPDDWVAFARFAVDEERMGDLLNPPRSAESFRTWARDRAADRPTGDCFGLVIESVASGDVVGAIGSHQADPRAGWFEYGVTIGADHRRKGYAAEAVVMLLRFMFAERRYHKCEARIFAHNEPSLALHRRLGFTEEDHRAHARRTRRGDQGPGIWTTNSADPAPRYIYVLPMCRRRRAGSLTSSRTPTSACQRRFSAGGGRRHLAAPARRPGDRCVPHDRNGHRRGRYRRARRRVDARSGDA